MPMLDVPELSKTPARYLLTRKASAPDNSRDNQKGRGDKRLQGLSQFRAIPLRITGSYMPSLTSPLWFHAVSMADGLRTARLGHVRAGWNQAVPKKGIVQNKSNELLRG